MLLSSTDKVKIPFVGLGYSFILLVANVSTPSVPEIKKSSIFTPNLLTDWSD